LVANKRSRSDQLGNGKEQLDKNCNGHGNSFRDVSDQPRPCGGLYFPYRKFVNRESSSFFAERASGLRVGFFAEASAGQVLASRLGCGLRNQPRPLAVANRPFKPAFTAKHPNPRVRAAHQNDGFFDCQVNRFPNLRWHVHASDATDIGS
jgi:hypothetical protein